MGYSSPLYERTNSLSIERPRDVTLTQMRALWYTTHMKIIYFDTETTGLNPVGNMVGGVLYPGQICQLAYIIQTNGVLVPKNFFFKVQYISPSASAVTGLTVPICAYLSSGRVFSDDVDEIQRDFAEADLVVAHNIAFDEGFMRAEMMRCGYPFELNERAFCSAKRCMREVGAISSRTGRLKIPSLKELADRFAVTDRDVANEMRWLYDTQKDAHDARHDTVKLYLALSRASDEFPHLASLLGRSE